MELAAKLAIRHSGTGANNLQCAIGDIGGSGHFLAFLPGQRLSLYVFGTRLLHDQVLILDGEFLKSRPRKGDQIAEFLCGPFEFGFEIFFHYRFFVFQSSMIGAAGPGPCRVCVVGPIRWIIRQVLLFLLAAVGYVYRSFAILTSREPDLWMVVVALGGFNPMADVQSLFSR